MEVGLNSAETAFTSKLDEMIGWARKFSIFQYPFVTACCGMEYMATACSHYDIDRFGAGPGCFAFGGFVHAAQFAAGDRPRHRL